MDGTKIMSNPYLIDTPFAINGDKNVIQDTERAEPNNPTWSEGWNATTSTPINSGGKPPKREDFNGVLYAVTDNLVHQAKGLGYEFDSAFATKIGGYPLGAKLRLPDGSEVVSTSNNNTNNPASNMTGWIKPQGGINSVESIADLTAIANPRDGQIVYVKGYFEPTNLAQAQPYVGGGYFYYTATQSTAVQGLVITAVNGGSWHRETKAEYSIEDFGALETNTAAVNGDAINIALANVTTVIVPSRKVFPCAMDKVNLKSGNRLIGGGTLQGTDPDLKQADVAGTYLRIDNCDNVIISDVKIKNGYKGKGVWMTNSRNITFNDFTVDGFSYGMWIGENDDGVGCKYININRPRMLNQKYWSIYVRSLGVSNDANKTQFVNCVKPYFYNANMAGFVVAEGHSKYITLDSPFFERCNVAMHFETCTDYTVINPRDVDTGKKPDMIPANTEYPYENWSMYHVFTQNAKIIGGQLESTCYHSAGFDAKSKNIQYTNTTAKVWVFEGVGDVLDTSKNFFENYSLVQCTAKEQLIYQQPTDVPKSYIKNLHIDGCEVLLGENGNSGNGSYIAVSIVHGLNFKMNNSIIKNSALRIKCEQSCIITGNTFNGTDETQVQLDGTSSALGDGNFLQFSGNIFNRAGGVVIGDSAILIKNWSRVRTDNTVRGNSVGYGYKFTDNYLIELGYSFIYDTTAGDFTESGTTALVYLYRA